MFNFTHGASRTESWPPNPGCYFHRGRLPFWVKSRHLLRELASFIPVQGTFSPAGVAELQLPCACAAPDGSRSLETFGRAKVSPPSFLWGSVFWQPRVPPAVIRLPLPSSTDWSRMMGVVVVQICKSQIPIGSRGLEGGRGTFDALPILLLSGSCSSSTPGGPCAILSRLLLKSHQGMCNRTD